MQAENRHVRVVVSHILTDEDCGGWVLLAKGNEHMFFSKGGYVRERNLDGALR